MEFQHPANFVSYYTNGVDLEIAQGLLGRAENMLSASSPVSEQAHLKSLVYLLQIQADLSAADVAFKRKQYYDALKGYRAVAKFILDTVIPQLRTRKTPKSWPGVNELGTALEESSNRLINILIPEDTSHFFTLNTSPIELDFSAIESLPKSIVVPKQIVPDEVLYFYNSAIAASEQGIWDKAQVFFYKALNLINGDDPDSMEMRANLNLSLGAVEVQLNEEGAALERLTESRQTFDKLEDHLGAAEVMHNMGLAYLRAGNIDQARASLDEARELASRASFQGLLNSQGANLRSIRAENQNETLRTPFSDGLLGTSHSNISGSSPSLSKHRFSVPFTAPVNMDTEKLASSLGSNDLELKFRALHRGIAGSSLKLVTPAQINIENFERELFVVVGKYQVQLDWTKESGLALPVLIDQVYDLRSKQNDPLTAGHRDESLTELAIFLPYLYHVILPIKMGDCLHHLGEYEEAQKEYRRAGQYRHISIPLEAANLWRRLAENILAWGDSFYRAGDTEQAIAVYSTVMDQQRQAADSFLYNDTKLKAKGDQVKAWLIAVDEGADPPLLNPALTHVLHTIRLRWEYIRAGLDFFGDLNTTVPPFTFKYLQEVARYFANRAIQAEQRYIDFYTRFENGQMTRQDLENVLQLSIKEEEAAKERASAANSAKDAAIHSATLSETRYDNADSLLEQFKDVDAELQVLAGHIARGNAFIDGDLPNLNYRSPGNYNFSGKKHEVLQQLTKRQTRISNELQQTRMENTVDELDEAKKMAEDQKTAAEARHKAAEIEKSIAMERKKHAAEMLAMYNNQVFNPEQWFMMATLMKSLSLTALYRAMETARLMQRAYNFEYLENREVISESYSFNEWRETGWMALTNDMLGGELLLKDIDSFTFHQITRIHHKPIPVRWEISLGNQFPGHFQFEFVRTGRMEFDIDLERVIEAHPGTYRHLLAGAELEIDGFLPPNGLHGRLTNSGFGHFRDAEGNAKFRLQPAETMVLSRYDRRRDSIILSPPHEMRALFESNSVASGWLLEIPKASNDVNLNAIFDVRLVLYFECLFDPTLFVADSTPLAGVHAERSRAYHLRFDYPDAFYSLRETGKANLELSALDFPINHEQPTLHSLALVMNPKAGETFENTKLSVSHPGQAVPVDVTVTGNNVVRKSALPIADGSSAMGTFEIEIDAAQIDRKEFLEDLVIVLEYRFTPAN